MTMKCNVPLLVAFVCILMGLMGLGVWAETSQPLPTPFPEGRYHQMSAKSPFAVATAGAADAAAAPTPGFAAQLYVDGIAHLGKTDFVAIKTRNPEDGKPPVVLVEVGKSTDDGIKVDRVQWSSEMGKSTVDVSKDGEKATLAFDEQTVKNPPAAPAQPGMQGMQGMQMPPRLPRMPGQIRPGNFAGAGPFQQPGPMFNRPRTFPQMMPNNMPGQPNGPTGVQRRARPVIPSGQ